MNKPVIAFVIAATAGVLVVLQKKSEGPPPVAATKQSSQEALRDGKSQLLSSSPETPNANLSDHKRVAGERTKTAKWHPTEKGKLISPYNHQTLSAIGVISGAKLKDTDDNTFFVPPFEQSPFPISPAGAPVPGRTGFFSIPLPMKLSMPVEFPETPSSGIQKTPIPTTFSASLPRARSSECQSPATKFIYENLS